jgi:cytochrome c-type biogenesis protein CcmE
MSTHLKLAIGVTVLACATAYLAYLGASTSWRYYVLVDECFADRGRLAGQRLRVSGRVAAHSLILAEDRSTAKFELTGAQHRLSVSCPGPLPDNLAEDMDVVVEGKLHTSGRLVGDKVLTRCASKYEAASVAQQATGAKHR